MSHSELQEDLDSIPETLLPLHHCFWDKHSRLSMVPSEKIHSSRSHWKLQTDIINMFEPENGNFSSLNNRICEFRAGQLLPMEKTHK